MRILFVSRWFPDPPDNGSKIRIFHLVKCLAETHDISFVALTDGSVKSEHMSTMREMCKEVHTVQRRHYEPYRARALAGILSTLPRYLYATHSPEMKRLVEALCRSWRPDAVIGSEIDSISHLKDLCGVPKFLDELQLQVIYDSYTQADSKISRWRHGLTWWKLSRFIRQTVKQFDGCTVTSEPEKKLLLQTMPGFDRCTVVPNAVDGVGNASATIRPVPLSLIYPGAMTFYANLDAMIYFLNDIYPIVLENYPRTELTITGRYDKVPLTSLKLNRQVRLSGYLDDIRQAIAGSWATIVPLRIGGGTRLKILESMSVGTPVISTTKGVQGLDVTHGKDVLIADSAREFAHSVVRLFENEPLRAHLSDNGRRLVSEKYAWQTSARLLEKMIESAAANTNK